MYFNEDTLYWFVPLYSAESRSTIPFLYIDEVKWKTPVTGHYIF